MRMIEKPIIDKKIVNADEYFQIKENIAIIYHLNYARIIKFNKYRNLKCSVFSYYN